MVRSLARLALLTMLLVTSRPAAAQRAWVAGTVAGVRHHALEAETTSPTRGVLLGAAGTIGWGPVSLHVGYAEGTVAPAGATGPVLAQGTAALRLHPIRSVTVAGGVLARSWITDTLVTRATVWQLKGRVDQPLIADARAFVELWVGTGTDDPALTRTPGARGGRAGLALVLGPFGLEAAYAVDHLSTPAARGGTLERIELRAGLGRP